MSLPCPFRAVDAGDYSVTKRPGQVSKTSVRVFYPEYLIIEKSAAEYHFTLTAAGSYQWFRNALGDYEIVQGKHAPMNDPNAKGALLGLTSRHGKGHFARALLEDIAFSMRQVYDLIRSAGVTAGIWGSLEDTVKLIEPQSKSLPVPENVGRYKAPCEKYCKFYDALKWSFQ